MDSKLCIHMVMNPNLMECFACELRRDEKIFYEKPKQKIKREKPWTYSGPQYCITKHCGCAIKPDAETLRWIKIIKEEQALAYG